MSAFIENERLKNLLFSWPKEAMEFLYDFYFDNFIIISEKYTHDRETSEEIVQDVFFNVWKNHKVVGQDRGESIQSYIIKAVEYKSISFYYRKEKANASQAQYLNANGNNFIEHPTEFHIISAEKNLYVRLILSTFPQRERECLLLQIDHGMSVKEIARQLNISKKAVERSLTSARKRLKKYRTRI